MNRKKVVNEMKFGKTGNRKSSENSCLPIYDSDSYKKGTVFERIYLVDLVVRHYCLSVITLIFIIVFLIYLIIPNEKRLVNSKQTVYDDGSSHRRIFVNKNGDEGEEYHNNINLKLNQKELEDLINSKSKQMEYFDLSSNIGNNDMLSVPDPNVNLVHVQEESGNFKKMTYQFSEKINITDVRKTSVFYHPTNGKVLGFNQKYLVSYKLCCSIFYKIEENSRSFTHSKKLCGNSDSIKCTIEDDKLMIFIDLSFLEKPNYFEVISICVLNWFSKTV